MKSRLPLVAVLTAASGFVWTGSVSAGNSGDFAVPPGAAMQLAQADAEAPGAADRERPADADRMRDEGAAGEMGAAADAELKVIRTSQLRGKDVENAQGEDLGNIEDVVLNRDGSVSYVVLNYGGTLGIGGKLFAVPWEQIQVTSADQPLIVSVSKERLDQLDGFNEDDYPEQPDFAAFEPARPDSGGAVDSERMQDGGENR